MSYRNYAEKLSQTTGLSISHAAVWNVIQALGDKPVHDEKELVETGKKEDLRGIAGSCFLWRGIKESLRGLRLCTKKTVARLP